MQTFKTKALPEIGLGPRFRRNVADGKIRALPAGRDLYLGL
jgi:hypothetical protein